MVTTPIQKFIKKANVCYWNRFKTVSTDAGNYKIKLTVENDLGQIHFLNKSITVHTSPFIKESGYIDKQKSGKNTGIYSLDLFLNIHTQPE